MNTFSPGSAEIIGAASLAATAVLAIAYVRRRRRTWNAIIDESIAYHRFHLTAIAAEQTVNEASRDLARQMLQILQFQFDDERRRYCGLRSLAAWRRRGTALGSCQQVFYRLYRDRFFDIAGSHDERLYRLLDTLVSALFRFYLVNSALSLPVIAYGDGMILMARWRLSRRGSHRLYADIAAAQKPHKQQTIR